MCIRDSDWSDLTDLMGSSNWDLIDSITFDVKPDSDLSNGDVVTVTASWNEDYEKKAGVKILSKEQEFTVEGPVSYTHLFDVWNPEYEAGKMGY